jgi:exodeoxyribonuclease VII small subunit
VAERKRKSEAESSFEELYAALEEKARKLEQGNLPLEESLKLYEEGAALADQLRAVLASAELRIRNVHQRFEPAAPAAPLSYDEDAEFGEDAYD